MEVKTKLTFFNLKDYKFDDYKDFRFQEDDLKRAKKFLNDQDRESFLIQRALLDNHLKETLNKKTISIAYTDLGKPYLENNSLYFNISHSDDYFMIGISSKEIGVDLEVLNTNRNLDKLSQKVLSPTELKEFEKSPQKEIFFYQIWTQKEAYLKCQGTGIRQKLSEIEVKKIKDIDLKFGVQENYYWASAVKR